MKWLLKIKMFPIKGKFNIAKQLTYPFFKKAKI
jgi:hypothetical protein